VLSLNVSIAQNKNALPFSVTRSDLNLPIDAQILTAVLAVSGTVGGTVLFEIAAIGEAADGAGHRVR
jgi:hypothetical protein